MPHSTIRPTQMHLIFCQKAVLGTRWLIVGKRVLWLISGDFPKALWLLSGKLVTSYRAGRGVIATSGGHVTAAIEGEQVCFLAKPYRMGEPSLRNWRTAFHHHDFGLSPWLADE